MQLVAFASVISLYRSLGLITSSCLVIIPTRIDIRVLEVLKKVVLIDHLHEGIDLSLARVEDTPERGHFVVAFLTDPIIYLEMWALVLYVVDSSEACLEEASFKTINKICKA